MPETIVDTSVVIDCLRGRAEALTWLEGLRAAGDLATHTVVVAETLVGARNRREQQQIERFFAEFRIHAISEGDAQASIDLLRQYRLRHGVGWHGCLIAATCRRMRLPITTLNEKHFAVYKGLTINRPY